MKKYELTGEIKFHFGRKLYQIKALISFGNVEAGELGGFIEKEENLSQNGNAWVYDDAWVYGDARVYDDACVCGDARVYDDAWVYGDARVYDDACVCGDARVYGNARVYCDACVYDDARVYDDACVCGDARVYGDACVCGNARVYGNAFIKVKSDILTIVPIGSRNDTTTFFKTKDKKINVCCGCFRGTIEEFEKAVEETHGGSFYEKQYKIAIELAKISIR